MVKIFNTFYTISNVIYGYSFDYKREGNAYFREEHRYIICNNNKNVVNNIDDDIFDYNFYYDGFNVIFLRPEMINNISIIYWYLRSFDYKDREFISEI